MKNFFGQLAIGLVLLVAGTTLGMLVEKHRSANEGKLRFLDFNVNKRREGVGSHLNS